MNNMTENPMVIPYYRHDDEPEVSEVAFDSNRICYYCGDVFPEKLKLDDEGQRCCPDCKAINEELDHLPPQTMKEAV